MSQPAEGTEAAAQPPSLPRLLIGEFKSFFDGLDAKMATFEQTGNWPAVVVLEKKKGKVQSNKPPKKPTAHNMFVKSKVKEWRDANMDLPEGKKWLMMANEEWKKLSKDEQLGWAEKATEDGDDEVPGTEGLAKSPKAAPAKTIKTAPLNGGLTSKPQAPAMATPTSPTKKRKIEAAVADLEVANGVAEDGTERKKKKKKKKDKERRSGVDGADE